jgi:Ca2+-binding RTX toxin-like protein
MSGSMAPVIDALDLALDTPQNLAFRPFASLDLSGGTVLSARVVVAAGLVVPTGALVALADTPSPGFTTYELAETDTEALEAALEALEFTFTDPVPHGGNRLVDFSLTIIGGTVAAPVEVDAGIAVHVGEADQPTSFAGLLPDGLSIPDVGVPFAPFTLFAISDGDAGALFTLDICWDADDLALLAGPPPLVDGSGTATLTLSGSLAGVNAAALALVFAPVANRAAPGASVTTTVTLVAHDDIGNDSVTTSFAVTATGVQDAPTLTGFVPYATMTDAETLAPFGAIDLEDPDAAAGVVGAQTLTATVTLSAAANGVLGGVAGASFDSGTGIWTFAGTTEAVEAALLALTFTPTLHQVPAGDVVTTSFAITVTDGIDTVADGSTTVDVIAGAIAITLDQAVLDLGTLAEGSTSGNIAALLLANARTAIPGNEAMLYLLGAANLGTIGIATLDDALQDFRFEADGFNALAPTDSFQYVIADGRGGMVTGTARFTITGPALPTLVGGPGDDVLVLPGWHGRVIGQGGADTITAGGGDNRIFGGWGDDVIVAHGYGNLVEGGPGADTIDAGEGNATVDGGNGGNGGNVITMRGSNNLVTAGDGDNYVYGTFSDSSVNFGDGHNRVRLGGHGNTILLGDGLNVIETGAGNATVIGGDGGNTILARGFGNLFRTGAGADDITAGAGNSVIETGGGNDIVRLGTGYQQRVDTGAGDDTVYASRSPTGGNHTIDLGSGNDVAGLVTNAATVMGGEGNDRLTATGSWNLLDGGAGADTLTGQGGDGNTLRGGEDSDRIITGSGQRSRLDGGGGDDWLSSGSGGDTLDGGAGNDSLDGGNGDDSLVGGAGADTLRGGAGRDTMRGGEGDDLYYIETAGDTASEAGGGGHDRVISSMAFLLGSGLEDLTLTGSRDITGQGNALDNWLTGNAGDNLLLGLQGADTLRGGAGDDTLVGHAGADDMVGGTGADSFRYMRPGDGGDRIAGFSVIDDSIEIAAAGFGNGLVAGMDLGAEGRFQAGAAATSALGTGQFTYDAATGALAWDANGIGGGGITLLATLGAHLAFTAADIVII